MSVADSRISNRPLGIMVGSNVPSSALDIAPLPVAKAVHTRLFALSSLSRLYSSTQAPLLTDPITEHGSVTLLPSVGAVTATVGGATLSITVIVMSALAADPPSPAVKRKT